MVPTDQGTATRWLKITHFFEVLLSSWLLEALLKIGAD